MPVRLGLVYSMETVLWYCGDRGVTFGSKGFWASAVVFSSSYAFGKARSTGEILRLTEMYGYPTQ